MSKVVTLPSIGDNQDPSSLEDGGGDDGVVSNSSWSVTDGVDMEEHPEEQQQPTAESSSDSYLILNKKPDERTYEDLLFLEETLKKVHFGQELDRDKRMQICRFLESESMKKNDVVFRQGDIGHEFFIIISGEVSISLKLAGEEEDKIIAALGAGDSFGELALIHKAAERKATIACITDCEFLKLHRTHHEATLKNETHRDISERVLFLKHVPLFNKLPYSKLESIALALSKREVKPKQILLRQDEELEDMFFIRQGSIKMIRAIRLCERQRKSSPPPTNKDRVRKTHRHRDPNRRGREERGPQQEDKPESTAVPNPSPDATQQPQEQKEDPPQDGPPENKLQRLLGKHRGAILSRAGSSDVEQKISSKKIFEVTMAALRAARDEKDKSLSEEDVSQFQFVHKIKRDSCLYLEVSAAGKYEYFGERCIFKNTRQPTTVMTTCTTHFYVLNKWDLLKRVDQKTIDIISESSHNQIDEDALKQQYLCSEKWETFKKSIVDGVMQDHRAKRERNPNYIWGGCQRTQGSPALPDIARKWR